jgi:hypothetical protein
MAQRTFGRFDNIDDNVYKVKRYCDTHACTICGCQAIMSEKTKYCRFHIPHDYETESEKYCDGGQCGFYKKNDSKYCKKHTCRYHQCQHERMHDIVEMGDLIFDTKYCENHHLLDQLCMVNYGFSLQILNIFDYLDFTDLKEDNVKIEIIKRVKELADTYSH